MTEKEPRFRIEYTNYDKEGNFSRRRRPIFIPIPPDPEEGEK